MKMYRRIFIALLFWTSAGYAQSTNKMNVDYMRLGCCYAASSIIDKTDAGGPAPSDNYPGDYQHFFPGIDFPKDGVSLVLDTIHTVIFDRKWKGYNLYFINLIDKTITLNAIDSRLNLLAEAWIDKKWQPIEYMPKVSCGNSRHKVDLTWGRYWKFIVPQYSGTIITHIRYKLAMPNGTFLYSNEVKASINPKQLTEKEEQ